MIETWDIRPIWRGIATGLLFSIAVWTAVAVTLWWALG